MMESEIEPMSVLMEFYSGTRCHYQILVPNNDTVDLQIWFNTHKWISARQFSYNSVGEECVDPCVTFVNLEHVASIRELDK